jgi:hypothetical protein
MSQNSPDSGTVPRTGKDIYIAAVAARKYATGKR